ncbi:MAG: caspase family protein [Myxococcota bacterium]
MPTFALAVGLTVAAQAGQVRHALVVGANDGGGVLEPLRYAESDAERMARVLVELGDFDDQLVTVLFRPTADQLRKALAQHAAIAEQYDDDLFLFYYSGHADGTGLRLGDQRYYFEVLEHDLSAVDSDVRLGILDACRSGSVIRLKGATVSDSLFSVQSGLAEGEAWLTASAADELAQESEDLRGGFFTHYLLSGMRGAADTGDGVVDLNELYRYTFDRVVDSTGRTGAGAQHPRFDYQLAGTGVLGLTDIRNASALLVLPAGEAGQVGIFKLPEKTQLAEFSKAEDRQMQIAVPPGTYLVRRRYQDATYEATLGVREGAQFKVEEWGRPVMELGVARGERVDALVDESLAYQDRLHLGDSPVVAGSASMMIPGAGQLYNGQFWKGIGYFAVTSSMLAGVVFDPASTDLGNGLWPTLGAAVWGASIADAAYNVHRRESQRPVLGVPVSWDTVMGGDDWPFHVGVSADLMLRKGVSIGLDRVGITPYPGGWDAQVGSRLMIAAEGRRFRPHALIALGARYGKKPQEDSRLTRMVVSAGGGLRYYVVPRYFLQAEGRWEDAGDWQGATTTIGMGIHLGR